METYGYYSNHEEILQNMAESQPTELDYENYQAAVKEFKAAQQQFDQADPEYVEIAAHRLLAAEMLVGVALRRVKGA